MSQYDKLDAAIIKAIRRGACSFNRIVNNRDASLEAHLIGEQTGAPTWRIVDRRLQAMRKKGRIAYAKGAWSVVEQAQEAAR